VIRRGVIIGRGCLLRVANRTARVVQDDAVTAGVLGLIERRIGVRQELA
jgi:hypothetical protein